MNVKKTAIIFGVSALMICGAIGLSIRLTQTKAVEMEVTNPKGGTSGKAQTKTYDGSEIMPLYYDEEEVLLLPLRNVVQSLGGTVEWQGETKEVLVVYRGKKLRLALGTREAVYNDYEIVLPVEPETINGSIYVDSSVVSELFSTEVIWDSTKRQISLKTKPNGAPIVAMTLLQEQVDGKRYSIEVPIVMGLNDASYEKSLNQETKWMLQQMADQFVMEEESKELVLTFEKGLTRADFLSYYWEGQVDGNSVHRALNIDLREQSYVQLSDLLTTEGVSILREEMIGMKEKQFYLTDSKELVLFAKEGNKEPQIVRVPLDGVKIGSKWNTKYKEIFIN